MPQERTEAVVLRGVDFSESSRIVTFLSPERGRLVCMAKGARRPKSPLSAVLDTMNRVELVYYWKEGRGVQVAGEVALLDGFGLIKGHLEKAAFASFALEVAGKVAHENEPSRALYATLARGLAGLAAWTGDVRAHVCWQVVQLLSVAGYEPALDVCVVCGNAISETPGFSYAGGTTCGACPADRRLTSEDYACLRALIENREGCPSLRQVGGVYGLLRHYAARQLETDLSSVRVLDEMFGG